MLKVIALLQRVGMTLDEIRDFLDPQLRGNHQWRTMMSTKSIQLRQRLTETQTALAGIEHALECLRPDLLDCPIFAHLLD